MRATMRVIKCIMLLLSLAVPCRLFNEREGKGRVRDCELCKSSKINLANK